MAEVLIRLVDKKNDDPYLDAAASKMGDVVAVEEDGWAWSETERTHSEWLLLSVPDAVRDDFDSYLRPEPGDPTTNRMLQRRGLKVDVNSLTLVAPTDLVTLPQTTFAHLQDNSFPAVPIPDPGIIGDDPTVIG